MTYKVIAQIHLLKFKRHIVLKRGYVLDWLVCALLCLSFFEPQGLTNMLGIEWDYVKYAVLIAVIFLTFSRIATFKIMELIKPCIFYGLFFLSILFSTYINGRDIFPAIAYGGQMISWILLVNYYAQTHKLHLLFRVMKFLLGTIIIINMAVQFINQDAFGFTGSDNHINFLTSDNFQGYWYIPFLLIVYLADEGKSKAARKIDICFWAIICVLSLIRAWAATCLLIFIVFLALLLLRKWKALRILTPFTSLMMNVVVISAIIVFQIQKYFSWLIEGILKKTMTLSGRVYIWRSALANIMEKPIFGHGTVDGGRLSINTYRIGLSSSTFFSHNALLEILIQGGIVAFVLFVVIYLVAHLQLGKSNGSEMKVLINISIFSLLLMQFSESAIYMPIANLPLILCFFYDDLVQEGFDRKLST